MSGTYAATNGIFKIKKPPFGGVFIRFANKLNGVVQMLETATVVCLQRLKNLQLMAINSLKHLAMYI